MNKSSFAAVGDRRNRQTGGLPFRYLWHNKIIYSVGRDLQDDKGSSAFKDGHKRDLSFPVDFQDSTNR